MKDLNIELWKLGITATTQHNEVAPAQHEMAPHLLRGQCGRGPEPAGHGNHEAGGHPSRSGVLLHEKPYAGVNGSGKHNNWSISTDLGENLMDPGDDPQNNLQFQLVLACILKAVDTHADLLRQSASDVGNDHRLGAQEAPRHHLHLPGRSADQMVQSIVSGTNTTALPPAA